MYNLDNVVEYRDGMEGLVASSIEKWNEESQESKPGVNE